MRTGSRHWQKGRSTTRRDLQSDRTCDQRTCPRDADDSDCVSDPIGSGFAASLARPSDNITGFTGNDPAIGGKWMELLKEIAPRTARVALLFNPSPTAQFLHAIH